MAKIPFEATFTGAYQFLFHRILSIIGTLWLPMLVMLGICAGIIYLVVPPGWWHGQFPVVDGTSPDPVAIMAVMRPIFAAYFPCMIVCLVFGAMMNIGILQLALGRKERCFVFFSLGADVWRLAAAWILMSLIMLLIIMLVVASVVLLVSVAKPLIGGWAVLLAVLCAIAGICFFFYVLVRLIFFLPAVAAAEHKIGLERAWELGRGNFWRIAGLCLAIIIPVMIVTILLQQIAIATPAGAEYARWSKEYYASIFQHHPKLDIIAEFRALWPLMPWFFAVGVLQNIATHGLFGGAIAKAYLAVAGSDEVKS